MRGYWGDNGDDSELVAGKAVPHEKELVADLRKDKHKRFIFG